MPTLHPTHTRTPTAQLTDSGCFVHVWCRRWWLAGGVSAVVSILQRTLGHITLPEATRDGNSDSDIADVDSSDNDGSGGAPAAPARRDILSSIRRTVDRETGRLSSGRAAIPPPLQPVVAKEARFRTHGSWLFGPCAPSADEVAERCLNVLYQVSLVVAGDEGVSGGSGGRLSGQSGQRSRKVYSPPARIFRRLARADVVSAVAQVQLGVGRGVLVVGVDGGIVLSAHVAASFGL